MDAPKLPQPGTITSFSFMDGVGRIKLEDGTELKVGSAGLKGVVSFADEERPVVGVRVKVHLVAPHPLGGFRAMKVTRVGKEISFKQPSSPEEWETKLHAAGLSEPHAATLRAAIRPAGQIARKKGAPKLGASKLGGKPDVPAGFVWPTFQKRPLAFLAQLRMADIPASVRADLDLPTEGLLAFFFDSATEPSDSDAAKGGSAVAFFEASQVLESMTTKGAPMFVESAVTIKQVWTPPPHESAIKLLEKDEAALRIYGAAFAEYQRAADAGRPVHRVGGNPLPVQAPMEEGRERLLLQLDSDEDSESSWGDDGRLYFLLKRPAPFEKARCVLQSG